MSKESLFIAISGLSGRDFRCGTYVADYFCIQQSVP